MHCIIKYIVQGKQARVKNANLRHPSSMCSCCIGEIIALYSQIHTEHINTVGLKADFWGRGFTYNDHWTLKV